MSYVTYPVRERVKEIIFGKCVPYAGRASSALEIAPSSFIDF
jgi:hypothetical protein